MKIKISVITAVLLALTQAATAQNSLSVADFTLPQSGGEMTVNFTLAEADVYTSYQFKVVTPDGIEYVVDESDDVDCTLGNGHDASHMATAHWNASISTLNIGVASMKSALLKGQEGSLTIPVDATTAEVGTTLNFTITDITFIRQTGVKDGIDDVNFTVTIGEPDDGRLKFYETSTSLPSYTAGDKANVKMFRTIKANEWSTIVLPFTLSKDKAETAFGSDVQLAEFDGFETEYADEDDLTPDAITIKLASYTMSAKKGMTGGKPFLIKTSKDIESFEADNVTLFNAVTDVTKVDEYDTSGKLTGSLVKTKIPADGLFISNNKFWYSTGETNIKAFRCWFELGAVLDMETSFEARVFLFFDETTGISDVHREASNDNSYYNLKGQRVENPTKGLYIKNNKKVLVK